MPDDPALWKGFIGLAVRQVDVWGGWKDGHWAPNGCREMEGLFVCLCRGVA